MSFTLFTAQATIAPPYQGQFFRIEPATILYTIAGEVSPITKEGQELAELMKKLWEERMHHFHQDKEKELLEAIEAVEQKLRERLAKNDPTLRKAEIVQTTNTMIRKAMETLESTAKRTAQEMYDLSAAAIDKKYKTQIRKMKTSAALKITKHVGIALGGGAVALGATTAGGALAGASYGAGAVTFAALGPAAIASLTVALRSGTKIYQAVRKEWPTYKKAAARLTSTLETLDKAIAYESLKREKENINGKLGVKDKVKLFFKDVEGKRKDVQKALGDFEAFSGRQKQQIEELAQLEAKMEESLRLVEPLAKLDPKLAKNLRELQYEKVKVHANQEKARKLLEKMGPTVDEAKVALERQDIGDVGKFQGVMGKLQSILKSEELREVGEAGGEVLQGASEVVASTIEFLHHAGGV